MNTWRSIFKKMETLLVDYLILSEFFLLLSQFTMLQTTETEAPSLYKKQII
jgi:hypothetical protein